MDEAKTGGPAFPVPDIDGGNVVEGMTLRDYFAAKAMQAIFSTVPHLAVVDHKIAAQESYEIADAMLKARGA